MILGEYMKRILLLFLVFLLTGCSAEYNLEINEDNIVENVTVDFKKAETDRSALEPYLTNNHYVYPGSDLDAIYKVSLNEDNSNYFLSYDYVHDYSHFTQSMFLSKCYENVFLSSDDKQINLATSDTFRCINMLEDNFQVDNVKISIKTNMKVIDNNADSVSGKVYNWFIDISNYYEKPIKLTIQKAVKAENVIKENDSFLTLIFVIVFILLVIFIFFILVKFKTKKNNNF